MKRHVRLDARGIRVTIQVDTGRFYQLRRDEVGEVVDRLIDGVGQAMTDAPYMGPRYKHEIRVRGGGRQ